MKVLAMYLLQFTDKQYGIDAKLHHQPSRSIKQIPTVHTFKGRQNINVLGKDCDLNAD